MGGFLSKPITDKVSADEEDGKLKTGASSMQGWRKDQEDAHNCLLGFDKDTYFFAVYDGHGGREVALYCSQKLPQFIKDTEAYKNNDLEKALIDGFLGFDATLTSEDVVAELEKLKDEPKDENEVSDEENVNKLYEEASMPLDAVIEKYMHHKPIEPLIEDLPSRTLESPYLRAMQALKKNCGSSKENEKNEAILPASSSNSLEREDPPVKSSSVSSVIEDESLIKREGNSNEVSDNKAESVAKEDKPTVEEDCKKSDNTEKSTMNEDKTEKTDEKKISTPNKEETADTAPQENGKISKKGRGKVLAKTKGVIVPVKKERPKRTAKQLYLELLASESESESEDEEDKTFQSPIENSSSEEEVENVSVAVEGSEESSSSDEIEDEEEDLDDSEEEEDEEMDDDDDHEHQFDFTPGTRSGCTAVVALMRGNKLYVANAGDSRCIVCREGEAVDMSVDHKPEDSAELLRINKAGGRVDLDGRVNGGLNVSRAIGDHSYKLNKELPDREQMISALPDIQTFTVTPADEFMVLACDGIWNFMTSQEVADFVKCRLEKQPNKVSQICEELFTHCLASNTYGDGTGCDNMTAIIIVFKSGLFKRAAPCDAEEADNPKRTKTEVETFEQQETSV